LKADKSVPWVSRESTPVERILDLRESASSMKQESGLAQVYAGLEWHGRDWFSSCSSKEDLLHWYSEDDAKRLREIGFVMAKYLATEYVEYEVETTFIKETSLERVEVPLEWSWQ